MNDLSKLHEVFAHAGQGVAAVGQRPLATRAGELQVCHPTLDPQCSNEQVLAFFTEHADIDNVAVLDGQAPIGLINRNIFMEAYAKPYARDVYGRKSCIAWMNKEPLVVDVDLPLESLMQRAVAKGASVLKDGFITVAAGAYAGIGSGFSLMQAMSDLEAEKTRQLMDSIHYASTIQQAYLKASDAARHAAFASHHLVWWPRDIVGGDCYFVRPHAGGTLVAVIDCTGHGVPGAFMTLIALSWFEQFVSTEPAFVPPGRVLQRLNAYVKRVLDQGDASAPGSYLHGARMGTDDGMDAAVIWIPAARGEIEFAGSRLSLLVCDAAAQAPGSVDGDRVGVGYVDSPEAFEWTSHRLEVRAGQRFVVVTDGVIDQIGGPRQLALGRKRLMQHLHETAGLDTNEAGECFVRFLQDWQGSQSRRDDVTSLMFTL